MHTFIALGRSLLFKKIRNGIFRSYSPTHAYKQFHDVCHTMVSKNYLIFTVKIAKFLTYSNTNTHQSIHNLFRERKACKWMGGEGMMSRWYSLSVFHTVLQTY
jgi:hypothetical protein